MVEASSLASRFANQIDPQLKAKAKAMILAGSTPKQTHVATGLNYQSIRTWSRGWLKAQLAANPLTQSPTNRVVGIKAKQTVSLSRPQSRARDLLTDAVESLAQRAKSVEDMDLASSCVDRLARAGKNLELWSGANSIVETSVAMLYEQAAQPVAERPAIEVESKSSGKPD